MNIISLLDVDLSQKQVKFNAKGGRAFFVKVNTDCYGSALETKGANSLLFIQDCFFKIPFRNFTFSFLSVPTSKFPPSASISKSLIVLVF
jgi:hypothetical protein